jgi:hypothetical protein
MIAFGMVIFYNYKKIVKTIPEMFETRNHTKKKA